MARNYRILGRVIERASRKGIPHLTVEAWDRDTRYHDMLGSQVTGAEGEFAIAFDDAYFGDYAPDRAPDVFFKVLRDRKPVHSTFESPLMNLREGTTEVTLELGAAAMPEPGKDRVNTRQMLKAARFYRQSDFKGVFREQRDKASMLGSFLAAAGGKALAGFDFEPVQPRGVKTSQVIGQDTASATANLAAQQVQVTEVKAYNPRTDAESARALGDFPLRVKAGDQVRLYEESGTVRYYAIVKPVAAADVDAETVARLDREVKDLKAEEISRLRTELAAVRQGAADKDAQIERLRTELVTTQREQRELATRISPEKLEALERQVKLLGERIPAPAPQPPAPQPPAPRPQPPAPPVIRGAKPKRGKGR
jgi:hypothetical protein